MEKKRVTRIPSQSPDSTREKQRDDAVIALIRGLDFLIAKANAQGFVVPVNILHRTKEDLVLWAVDYEFQETRQDKFIHSCLYSDGMALGVNFIMQYASLKEGHQRQKLIIAMDALLTEYIAMTEAMKIS